MRTCYGDKYMVIVCVYVRIHIRYVYEFTNLFQMYLNHYLCAEPMYSELLGMIVFVFFLRCIGLV